MTGSPHNNRDAALRALAEAVARQAHAEHVDKSGAPYIGHLERVAAAVAPDADAMAAAWLHDLVEDQPHCAGYLMDFPPHIIRTVYLLTKVKNEPNALYFARIKADPLALKVKLADIADNMSPERMGKLDAPTQERLRAKYANALALLTQPADSGCVMVPSCHRLHTGDPPRNWSWIDGEPSPAADYQAKLRTAWDHATAANNRAEHAEAELARVREALRNVPRYHLAADGEAAWLDREPDPHGTWVMHDDIRALLSDTTGGRVMEVKVGDRIKDNDPRMSYRVLTILSMNDTHVWASPRGGPTWKVRISRARIHTNGKPRRSGFSLIPSPAVESDGGAG